MTKTTDAPGVIAEVAVGLPVSGTFHYQVPPRLVDRARVGVGVQVPFGHRKVVTGFILGLVDESPRDDLREIQDIPDSEPLFDATQLPFYRFIAEYYFAPLGEVLRTALPGGLFRGSQVVVSITENGLAALKNPLTDEVDRRILGALAGREQLTVPTLASRVGGDVNRDMQRLLRWDFLAKHYRLAPLSAKRKVETVWRLRPGTDLAAALEMVSRRASKREALLRFLAEVEGWVGLERIREAVADPRPALNSLVSAGLVEAGDREVYRNFEGYLADEAKSPPALTDEQRHAVERIEQARRAGRHKTFLLFGVTGSGKTEVYLNLARACVASGKSAIVLVPEIALTPQFLGRFVARLGPIVAPFHSGLSDGERYDQWRRMRRGEARVAVGARSALFAPFTDVGAIVVDEEHEHSYKQDDGVAYHARDLAIKLGSLRGCPVVLGSATPSLETYAAAKQGRYELLRLTSRPTQSPMPVVQIVDMRAEMARREKRKKGAKPVEEKPKPKETSERRVLSAPLAAALRETTAAGEQSILFLNRRGYSTYAFCLECGAPLKCPLCDISLTYSAEQGVLRCHYCDYTQRPPATCPACAGVHLFYGGVGTERLEAEVGKLLPEARVARLDRDTVRGKHDLNRILGDFARGDADVLVGTQMVAKGHDFPRVTLVGVIDADGALMLPDFRAAERAFSLVCQVSGRAGRADRPGRVLVQSFQPDHYAIRAAAAHDYEAFFAEEFPRRERTSFPPSVRLAVVRIVTLNAKLGLDACKAASRAAASATARGDIAGASTLGPAASLLHRVRGKHAWHLILRAATPVGLHKLCYRVWLELKDQKYPSGTFRLDIDPTAVM